MDEQEYSYLKKKFYKLTNINLDYYKDQQMRRRLNAYVEHSQNKNVIDFCQNIENNPQALEELLNYIAINVSEFFRDTLLFNQLESNIIPALLKQNPQLRIWSAGCSHGEEPYTLAMILDRIAPSRFHTILATDIDEEALRKAKAGGPYSSDVMKGISPEVIQKYFVKQANGNYMVSDKLKQRINFRRHNLLVDAYEQKFDLILCRNVTIYFTDEAKNGIYRKFLSSLREGGVLFTGGTEVILNAGDIGLKNMKSAAFYQKPELKKDLHQPVKAC
jgi:chemotaxis protein methyltransferase CheR